MRTMCTLVFLAGSVWGQQGAAPKVPPPPPPPPLPPPAAIVTRVPQSLASSCAIPLLEGKLPAGVESWMKKYTPPANIDQGIKSPPLVPSCTAGATGKAWTALPPPGPPKPSGK